jgi:hypothetical protein
MSSSNLHPNAQKTVTEKNSLFTLKYVCTFTDFSTAIFKNLSKTDKTFVYKFVYILNFDSPVQYIYMRIFTFLDKLYKRCPMRATAGKKYNIQIYFY